MRMLTVRIGRRTYPRPGTRKAQTLATANGTLRRVMAATGTSLTIALTRLSPTHHRFAVVRADGSSESVELETRSCLVHDLVHFALECEAGLLHSFYGQLAGGTAYAALTMTLPDGAGELLATERLVGGLQGMLQKGVPVDRFLAAMSDAFAAHGERLPAWCTPTLIARVQERMRRLNGEWRALPFGQTMWLRFPKANDAK